MTFLWKKRCCCDDGPPAGCWQQLLRCPETNTEGCEEGGGSDNLWVDCDDLPLACPDTFKLSKDGHCYTLDATQVTVLPPRALVISPGVTCFDDCDDCCPCVDCNVPHCEICAEHLYFWTLEAVWNVSAFPAFVFPCPTTFTGIMTPLSPHGLCQYQTPWQNPCPPPKGQPDDFWPERYCGTGVDCDCSCLTSAGLAPTIDCQPGNFRWRFRWFPCAPDNDAGPPGPACCDCNDDFIIEGHKTYTTGDCACPDGTYTLVVGADPAFHLSAGSTLVVTEL